MLIRILLLALIIAAVAAGVWWYQQSREDTPRVLPPHTEPRPDPPPRYPVPEPRPSVTDIDDSEVGFPTPVIITPPLPPLEISDPPLRAALAGVVDEDILRTWLIDQRIIERSVVVINSLDGPAIPLRLRPLRHIPGLPEITRTGDDMQWSPDNITRYQPLLHTLRATDPADIADLYFRYYPLFQQAYTELGMPERHFNDRLIDIIDHLLAAPVVAPDFPVTREQVLYQYADPNLEAESWGRKMLMRIGPDAAEQVKTWLRDLRGHLTADQATDD